MVLFPSLALRERYDMLTTIYGREGRVHFGGVLRMEPEESGAAGSLGSANDADGPARAGRKRWVTPRVIVSEAHHAGSAPHAAPEPNAPATGRYS